MANKFSHTIGAWAAAGRSTKLLKTHVADSLMVWQGQIDDTNTPGNVLLADGVTELKLPAGFIPLRTLIVGAAASGQLDLGLVDGTATDLADDVAADSNSETVVGAGYGVALTADDVVSYTDGGVAAGAGTAKIYVMGVMARAAADLFMR